MSIMVNKHVTMTIKTDDISDWAQEEFCEYLTEKKTLKGFIWFLYSVDSLSVLALEQNVFKLDFTFTGYVYDWMDDPESDIIINITEDYGKEYNQIYMGIEPIKFIVSEITVE